MKSALVFGAAALGVLLSAAGAAEAAPCPARASWPTREFQRRTEEASRLFPERVKALEEYMFTLHGEDEERAGVRTDSLVVIHQGAIFYERYARGYTRESPHLAWSVSKTITQLLTGLAVAGGALAIDDSVCKHIAGAPSGRCSTTVRNLLDFGSGFDWKEDYEGTSSRQSSTVIAMLYGQGRDDMVKFMLGLEQPDPPGTAYRYSTGDSTLLAGIVDAVMRRRLGPDYPWLTLFEPLGITTMTMELDGMNNHVGGAYTFATTEDWARLGFFMLNDGCWEGTRMLPENWIADATTPQTPFLTKRNDSIPQEEQGRQLWINRTIPGIREPRPWPNMPEDTFSAIGHWGQFIAVIPSRDVIIVRSGDDRDEKALDVDKFLSLSLAITGDTQ